MDYEPIDNYGIIGNMRTTALVSVNASIDWYCSPRFDSPSVFGKILDSKKGGSFKIWPASPDFSTKQFYWPDTNVLVTRFFSEQGIVEIQDFMPLADTEMGHHQIIRYVRCVRGEVSLKLDCSPAFNYGRDTHETELTKDGAVFSAKGSFMGLSTALKLKQHEFGVESSFRLKSGESCTLSFRLLEKDCGCGLPFSPEEGKALFDRTVGYWRSWLSKCTYQGRWREMVQRSALTLKLLTYQPTGAIVAAATCSLPEEIGGGRNWDYRYTWIRDAAFTLYGFMRIGFREEASAFMGWLQARLDDADKTGNHPPLQIVYGIQGETELEEIELNHWEGHQKSSPVRIGNKAAGQLQLDIYGELLDSIYLYNKHGSPISFQLWTNIQMLLRWLEKNWTKADEGIWEVRSGQAQFTYSKLMCWVAFDRALRLADKRSFPLENRNMWYQTRDEIYQTIMDKSWSQKDGAFMQTLNGDTLDASSLLMPLVFFMAPDDPRMLSTIKQIMRSPCNGGLMTDGLIYRYNRHRSDDGLSGKEGTFNMCSFWLVENLTRAGRTNPRMLDDARNLFERMLGYSNHLGLYAEQTSIDGKGMGNFPQAFTHLALISAAFNLDRVLDGKKQAL